MGGRTAQGAADSSAWARGQAWGLYGFTEAYRKTGHARYLHVAARIADFILKHSVGHLPENSEVDVPLTYADYYFLEGLLRLKELSGTGSLRP